MTTYEVTVPVTVTVQSEDDGTLRVMNVAYDQWGGFFSEAEEACGVWDADNEVWADKDLALVYGFAFRYIVSSQHLAEIVSWPRREMRPVEVPK